MEVIGNTEMPNVGIKAARCALAADSLALWVCSTARWTAVVRPLLRPTSYSVSYSRPAHVSIASRRMPAPFGAIAS